MRLLACFALGLLASCATAPPPVAREPAPAAPSLGSAGAEIKSWGVTLRQWTVNATGQVEFSSGGRPGVDPATVTIEVRRFKLSAEKRSELAAAVRKVEAALARPEQCDQSLTDGPYGKFRWDWGEGQHELPFSANCIKGRDAELANAVFAADAIVLDASAAVQPVERRPASLER
jgi:hypothetical protein